MATDTKPGGQSSRGLSDLLGRVLNRGLNSSTDLYQWVRQNKYNFGFPQRLLMFGPSPKKEKKASQLR